MLEFYKSLSEVYTLAENHPGFIWRVPDNLVDKQLTNLGFDNLTSSTVSTWDNLESLMDYTYNSLHGEYLKRSSEWFKKVEGPQLVIWDVENDAKPTFKEAFERLNHLRINGSTNYAYGWKK
jgi:hypothetical protein|tara:strand:+ start:2201 stop:2566 length:366 start_codon:yes stop_codon:yes gene_type:complete